MRELKDIRNGIKDCIKNLEDSSKNLNKIACEQSNKFLGYPLKEKGVE